MVMNERTLNGHIADAMDEQAPPGFVIWAEEHGTDQDGQRVPDIHVDMPYGLRGMVELEYGPPAVGDAIRKLGYQFKDANTLPMKSILAVGIPEDLGKMPRREREAFLKSDEPHFLMQVVTGSGPQDPHRTIVPERPVAVSLRDLVHYAWLTAIPEDYSQQELAKVIRDLNRAKAILLRRLKMLGDVSQARLLASYNPGNSTGIDGVAGNVVGTLTSMMQLHLCLKEWSDRGLEEVLALGDQSLWQQTMRRRGLPDNLAREWRKIEFIDYKPLSTLAAAMLEHRDLSSHLGDTLRVIYDTLHQYVDAGISVTTNVAAEVWQELIPDRDQRAAYYTKPVTAEMLANLTVPRLASPAAVRYNEICAGTGTLARATEENIRFRHYADTDNKASIHAQRMESCIRLTDINQQSVSVATANMAGLEPNTPYRTNAIFAITAEGGALNYLTERGVSDMLDTLIGRDGERSDMLALERHSAGICNNNDPYFVARRGAKNPVSSKAMQYYKRQADRRVKGVANGNAGLAAFMHVIEHELLAYGGVHGKVLPLKAAHAETWDGFRRNIENAYREVVAISTAAGDGVSMSADTNVQEMLVVATKQSRPKHGREEEGGDRAVTCVNLTRTFATRVEAKMFADAIRREMAKGEATGEISVGGVVGTYYRMTGLGAGKPWSALGSSGKYTTLVEEITAGKAWNPDTGRIVEFGLPMTTLGQVVAKGPTHHYIGISADSEGTHPTGAFLFYPEGKKGSSYVQSNPAMWNVQAGKQASITCQPTHYGEPRSTPEEAEAMRASAGHFHLSRGLRMSAQKIAVAYTETACMGGRSWNTLKAEDGAIKAVTLFLNSTYGILIRAGYGQSSDLGRSPIQVNAIDAHPLPDFAGQTPAAAEARRLAVENFDRLRQLELERIALAALDPNRAEIDRVVTLMLGLPWDVGAENMLAEWRRMMCRQPAINANNKGVLAALAAHGIQ